MRRITIVQGEYHVAWQPHTVIATLLGSCIGVCLFDAAARVGGMNHFLLGEPDSATPMIAGDMHRYGIHAMELLINAMMQRGAMRNRLRAHIYGGAKIVAGLGEIGSSNAAFARQFMATEGIAIGHIDVGGVQARKVEFMPYEGRVRSARVAAMRLAPLVRQPALPTAGEVELF